MWDFKRSWFVNSNVKGIYSCAGNHLGLKWLERLPFHLDMGNWLMQFSQWTVWFRYAHTICINNTATVRHLLSFQESEIVVDAKTGDAYDQPQDIPRTLVSNGLPWRKLSPTCCWIFIAGGREDALCDPSGEAKNLSKRTYGFSQTLHVLLLWFSCEVSLLHC